MAKGEKFHEMVARVAGKSPAHAQAIAAFNRHNGNPPVAAPKPGKKVKPPLLRGTSFGP
jgi:hypothetical protein